jgi:hypothetical protein
VKSCLDACDLAIAVFDINGLNYFNPNISLEVGYMLAREGKLRVLKDKTLNSSAYRFNRTSIRRI